MRVLATLVLLLAALDEPPPVPRYDALPTPTPTPGVVRLLAALESTQGVGTERTALFDDGTVANVVRHRERERTLRRTITTNERDLVRRVCAEVLQLPPDISLRTPVLPEGARRLRLEVTADDGVARVFEFGELTPLPLAIGRARQALDDLRSPFYEDLGRIRLWDPAAVQRGELLRRRRDGRWFEVYRDDSFEKNLELVDRGGLERMFLARSELPKVFEDPGSTAGAPPEPEVPEPQPR